MRNVRRKKLSSKGIKTTVLGIIVSFFLAAVKIFSGIIGNSYALVADGIESVADVFTSFIVLTGLKISVKPPDENHPYGHGKAEPLAGMMVAVALFIAAAVIIYQSVNEIITPHHAPEAFTLIVLILVVMTKEVLFRYISKIGASIESIAVKNDAWHHRSDAITSSAAFIGISIALIGGDGYESADDFAALFASIIIIINGFLILKPTLYELTDANISNELAEKLITDAKTIGQIYKVEKLFIRKMGFDYFVDAHIIVNGKLTVEEGHEIAHKFKDKIMNTNKRIYDVMVHVEPDSNLVNN
jgi:cation diffusion facilitator family transporter